MDKVSEICASHGVYHYMRISLLLHALFVHFLYQFHSDDLPRVREAKRENSNKLKRIMACVAAAHKATLRITIHAIIVVLVALVFLAGYLLISSQVRSRSEFSRYEFADVVFDGTVISKERPKVLDSLGIVRDDLDPTDLLVCGRNGSSF